MPDEHTLIAHNNGINVEVRLLDKGGRSLEEHLQDTIEILENIITSYGHDTAISDRGRVIEDVRIGKVTYISDRGQEEGFSVDGYVIDYGEYVIQILMVSYPEGDPLTFIAMRMVIGRGIM